MALSAETDRRVRLEEISVPVCLWHGEEDADVSISAARYAAHTIPD